MRIYNVPCTPPSPQRMVAWQYLDGRCGDACTHLAGAREFIQGWSLSFKGKNCGECAVRGFKLRFTGLSIDRPQRDHAFRDGPVTGLGPDGDLKPEE